VDEKGQFAPRLKEFPRGIPDHDPIGYYGVPAGSSRAEVRDTLLRTFGLLPEKKAAPSRPEAARPAEPCKALRHFPAPDRRRKAAVIYAMQKRQPNAKPKAPKGRPPIPGRRVVIKLEERHIKRAAELGNGNVAAGIRSALG